MFVRVPSGLSLAIVLALAPMSAQALVFEFFWSGEVGANGVVASTDETLRITGLVEIDALAGESFDQSSFASASLSVSGSSITDFVLTSASSFDLSGTIDGSGAFATFDTSPAPFLAAFGEGFGCSALQCSDGEVFVTNNTLFGPFAAITYGDATAAAQSFVMTAQKTVVPLPATLPLAAAGILGLGLFRRLDRA